MLKGKKVRLRPAAVEDLAERHAWFNDPEVVRPYLGRLVFTPKRKIEENLSIALQLDPFSGYLELAVENLDDARYVGNIFLRNIRFDDRSAEFGIFIGVKECWDAGLGSEATTLMLSYGFEELHLHRIWLTVFSFNKRAIRCFEKCGFNLEGLLKETLFAQGSYHDTLIMAILDKEWKSEC